METLFRLRSALSELPQLTEQHNGVANDWVQMLYLLTPQSRLSAGLNADASKAKIRITDDFKELTKSYLELIQVAGFGAAEAEFLKKGLKFRGGEMSVWLEVGGQVQNAGWEVHNSLFPLAELWPLLGNNAYVPQLKAWFAHIDTDAFVRLGRSMGGQQYTYFTTVLPGGDVYEDIEAYQAFCEAMNITPLPQPILDEIIAYEPDFLELTLGLDEEGLVFITLTLPEPNEALTLKMTLALTQGGQEATAAFEGSLGSPEYSSLSISRTGKGIEAQWQYQPFAATL